MNKAEQLREAADTHHWVLVEFYTDQSPQYDWLDSTVERYGKLVSKRIEVIKVNLETERALANSYHIGTTSVFLLLLHGKELWRGVGRLTERELLDVLGEF